MSFWATGFWSDGFLGDQVSQAGAGTHNTRGKKYPEVIRSRSRNAAGTKRSFRLFQCDQFALTVTLFTEKLPT